MLGTAAIFLPSSLTHANLSRPMRYLSPLLVSLSLVGTSPSAAVVEYRVSGTLVKQPLSDNLFNSSTARAEFEVRFTADTALAVKVPAGTRTSLPSFGDVVLPQDGFVLPAKALKSFAFRAAGTGAQFSVRDVIANDLNGGSIFLTGALNRPSGINILLANGVSGYVEIGILECTPECALRGGLVLDRAGPFGTIELRTIETRAAPSEGQ
jgi:hypothetical protein